MNNDLISRESLKKALNEQMNFDENCRDSVFDIIDNSPTADVLYERIINGDFGLQRKEAEDEAD